MPVLSTEQRLSVLAALVDGNSARATSRMTDVNLRTILRLGVLLGEGAQHLHDRLARDLAFARIENDEIWSYVGKKQARVTEEENAAGLGEAYTFVALAMPSRFVVTWKVGKRDQETADAFVKDLRARLVVMPAMTSDGFPCYPAPIGENFGKSIDYAQTVKNYSGGDNREDRHYEPGRKVFITKKTVYGAPDLDKATTAHVERNNGTMRHFIGRMRRLVYAFSKKIENHTAAVALCYAYYNFCWVVKTLRVTPAMAAGVTDHIWDLPEFMEALLSAKPAEKLVPKPLAHHAPEGPARALPGGRGFLRLLEGGGAPSSPSPAPGPAPVAPVAPMPAVASSSQPAGVQLDLLSWVRPPDKPAAPRQPVQLDLFGMELKPAPK